MNITRIIIQIIILVLCFNQVHCQSATNFEDKERILVIGIRYFDHPIEINSDYHTGIVAEKEHLDEFVDKDTKFYTDLWSYEPHAYVILDDDAVEPIRTLIIPQLNNDTLVDIVCQQLGDYGMSISRSKLMGKGRGERYKNIYYLDVYCKRFLVVLVSKGALRSHWHIDVDPPLVERDPKWGLYTKYLIPLPIGDTTRKD